ncbi:MAG TPA: MmgE/PrpD family protein [Solirubrobacteraceae bacterium]|jgi:2-methylcitrate dehydratase PrpD|nr:MmgE/PrpD family protein [Solirubrobacteraceae bacterium]
MTLSGRLARFALALREPPAAVARAGTLHALDALGCGLAACALGEGTYARAAGAGPATVLGHPDGLAPGAAALANGTLCHALDFDDTHPDAIAHVSAVVVPAALAAGQDAGARGADVLAAIVAGSEAVARIGAVAVPSYMTRGFHPTSVCGIFGAVLAAARVRGLDEVTTVNALGVAGSFACGLFEYLADGASTKPLHAGWAAQSGLAAVDLARAGATGPATVLEGRFGVLPAFFGVDGEGVPALPDDGGVWETARTSYKPYPACHFIHSSLDACVALRAEHDFGAEEIEAIELLVPPPAVPLVLEPTAAKLAPRTPYDAKFSLPYSVAAMLVRGAVGVGDYTAAAIADREVLALAARCTHAVGEFDTFPGALPGAVTLRLRDGRVLSRTEPRERALSEPDVIEKYRANASLALGLDEAHALERAVLGLAEVSDLRAAFAPLGRAGLTRPARAA